MITDANSLTDKTLLSADICIVGAGAAGITLTREFIGSPFNILLLESGGTTPEAETQRLLRGTYIGDGENPLTKRARYLGGTTNMWAGWCRPFDEIDFIQRDTIPFTGWPFDKKELDPYYLRAHEVCNAGPPSYHLTPRDVNPQTNRVFIDSRSLITTVFQFSTPILRFGRRYRSELEKASNIKVLLHANVTNIDTSDSGKSIDRINVTCLSGKSFKVRAKTVVLAAGGIENARLMLASNKKQPNGLGNQHDLVGRFFMIHPHFTIGWLQRSNPEPSFDWYTGFTQHNEANFRGLCSLGNDILFREKLPNCSIKFSQFNMQNPVNRLTDSIANTISEMDYKGSYVPERSGFNPKQRRSIQLIIRSQQLPNPDSRLMLGDKQDALGMPRAKLYLKLSENDYRLVERTAQIIAQEFGKSGLGRLYTNLKVPPTWPSLWCGGHHMGLTRMHNNPKKGVVDQNCKVHGISNLFIAGPSVFTTGGYANPVLTIVALALRLGDHIKRTFA